jgi:hypothetical protein
VRGEGEVLTDRDSAQLGSRGSTWFLEELLDVFNVDVKEFDQGSEGFQVAKRKTEHLGLVGAMV